MLPDMSDVLTEWETTVTMKIVTQTTVDFVNAFVVTPRTVKAVVQNAQRDQLSVTQIETGQAYKWFHTKELVKRGEFMEFEGADYKIVNDSDFQRYGYSEGLAEATNEPVIS